jgi:hypothetical protein
VLIPVATALCGIAFGFGVYSYYLRNVIGSMLTATFASLTFTLSFIAMVSTFVAFGAVQSALEKEGTSTRGEYDLGIWTLLASTVCLLLGATSGIVACSSRRKQEKNCKSTTKKLNQLIVS